MAPRAMIADALATAICVVGEERAESLLSAYPGAQALITRTDGTTERLGQAAACLPFGVTSAV